MNIELYIADELCDLEKSDLSIRLKRQFINPTQLNTKDAQKSYTLTLPSTPTNDQIFRYANVEETSGKFSFYPNAKLYVNGILILDGKFRLTEIAPNSYKGNLGVPAPLTAKDVFGERMMNDAGEWKIDFNALKDLSSYNNGTYNKKQYGEIPPAIFPFVLYGLIPNEKQTGIDDNTIDRASITSNSCFELEDFPASVNCLQMLQAIFKQANYSLTGTAMSNELLKNLYVSYKNPNEYTSPFPPQKVVVKGNWSNRRGSDVEHQFVHLKYDTSVSENVFEGTHTTYAVCDLFQSDLIKIDHVEDRTHITKMQNDKNIEITIPEDGLYKIRLDAKAHTLASHNERTIIDKPTGEVAILSGYYSDGGLYRNFHNVAIELKLVRYKAEKYNILKEKIDNTFYKNNQNQNHADPKQTDIFPQKGGVNFVDYTQNANLLCGFSWGRICKSNHKVPIVNDMKQNYRNPLSSEMLHCNPIATKHGYALGTTTPHSISAVKSSTYLQRNIETVEKYSIDFVGEAKTEIINARDPNWGLGTIDQLVWLEKGEKITLVDVTDMANRIDWLHHDINFEITLEPITPNKDWLVSKMNNDGSSKEKISPTANDIVYLTKDLNLIKFLPSETKIDEWIEDFCKAFNLELISGEQKSFELNLKNKTTGIGTGTSRVIDLDRKSHVAHATNESLNLPRIYELGFTIDKNEEGYADSIDQKQMRTGIAAGLNDGATGGGTFYTQSNEPNVVKQNSKFSYCWYKQLTDNTNGKKKTEVPIVTEKEVWNMKNDYREMLKKTYHNKAQRFWFKDKNTIELKMGKEGASADIALVKNTYEGNNKLWLNYEDKPDSIMRNYFTLLTNQKNYTVVECYLTPEEYNDLDKSLIRFNGDLYTVAEADGYDPLGNAKTKMKLIKDR